MTYVVSSSARVAEEHRWYLECSNLDGAKQDRFRDKRVTSIRFSNPHLNCTAGEDRASPAIRLPNSPRMYPPTFTMFSWHAGACRASNTVLAA